MIELSPTMVLMACLLAASLLGAGIGACLWHLRLARRHAAALAARQAASEREREAFDAMLAQEREMVALKHDQDRRRVAKERERAERAIARHEALVVREREQSRCIEVLEARVLVLGEKRTDSLRDPAGGHAGRLHGSSPLRPTVSRIDDDHLPVLNRRVGTRGSSASAEDDGLSFGGDLEIPALAESELPDAGDDLVLDLLEGESDERDSDG